MPAPLNPYDLQLLRNQAAINRRILKLYEDGITSITPTLSTVKFKGKLFKLADYPALQKRIDKMIQQLQPKVYSTVVNGIKDSWDLSNKKNNVLVDKRLAGRQPKAKVRQVLYDPNKGALASFINRKEKGLGLSDRVWSSVDQLKNELEQGLGLGISKGQSAASMAREMKQYLKEPDKLFRRVRNEEGKLVLSEAARNYHPGQGVYRSSFKNALRVTRTETNDAYRTADHERWKNLPFVTGIMIKLSNAHPKYDICDHLVGIYPKDFKFRGWHPQCICFATPEMLSDEEYDKLEDQILNGKPIKIPSNQLVKQPPAAFGKYVQDNKDMLAGLKNKPYWMSDNAQYVKQSGAPIPEKKPIPEKTKSGKTAVAPAGEKISAQFTNVASSIRKDVTGALETIDKVHGDGILDNIPFDVERRKVSKGTQAMFYSTPTGKPAKITLKKSAGNPQASIVHEMGHMLDLQAIGGPGKFNSNVKGSPVSKILAAAEKTDKVKGLRKLLEDGFFMKDGETIPLSWEMVNHVKYLLDPRELWARSYTQFVGKRSGSVAMKTAMEDIMELQKRIPHKYQWEGADFDILEKAIEEMMVDIGWISR